MLMELSTQPKKRNPVIISFGTGFVGNTSFEDFT